MHHFAISFVLLTFACAQLAVAMNPVRATSSSELTIDALMQRVRQRRQQEMSAISASRRRRQEFVNTNSLLGLLFANPELMEDANLLEHVKRLLPQEHNRQPEGYVAPPLRRPSAAGGPYAPPDGALRRIEVTTIATTIVTPSSPPPPLFPIVQVTSSVVPTSFSPPPTTIVVTATTSSPSPVPVLVSTTAPPLLVSTTAPPVLVSTTASPVSPPAIVPLAQQLVVQPQYIPVVLQPALQQQHHQIQQPILVPQQFYFASAPSPLFDVAAAVAATAVASQIAVQQQGERIVLPANQRQYVAIHRSSGCAKGCGTVTEEEKEDDGVVRVVQEQWSQPPSQSSLIRQLIAPVLAK